MMSGLFTWLLISCFTCILCSLSLAVSGKELKVFIFTYNVNNEKPTEEVKKNMKNVFGLNGIYPNGFPDVYAIGLQETPNKNLLFGHGKNKPPKCVGPRKNKTDKYFGFRKNKTDKCFGPRKNKPDEWSKFLTTLMAGHGYIKVGEKKMVQIKLMVFAKQNIANKITDVETSSVKTGCKGMFGNKGGVALRMTINGSHICFISCHLAAFDEKLQKRISDYNSIVFNMKFENSKTPHVLSHDHVLLMGDLNMRIDDLSPSEVIDKVKEGSEQSRDVLLAKDQLNQLRKEKSALHEFDEQFPKFWPTYKFIVGTNDYNSDTRKPAFTDRILHKKVDKSLIRQEQYRSHPEFKISDHIPVSTLFTLSFTYRDDIWYS